MTSTPSPFDGLLRAASDFFGDIQEDLRPAGDPARPAPHDPEPHQVPDEAPALPAAVVEAAARVGEIAWAEALATVAGSDSSTQQLQTVVARQNAEIEFLRAEVAHLRAALDKTRHDASQARAAQARAEGVAAGLREARDRASENDGR